jgi:two-component system, cell cycle sensor histidine kinase and response regulator CckA
MKILIVDDLPKNLKLLRVTLEAEGVTVVEAHDGAEAFEKLQHTPVDAIVSDILMPRMDGYQFCSKVRQNEKFDSVPFIFYSATYTSPSDEEFAIEMGADRLLHKPASARDIIETIKSLKSIPHERRKIRPSLTGDVVLREYTDRLVSKLEEKNVELEELTAELQKLTKAVEQTADNIIITDKSGKIQYVNPAFERNLGYAKKDLNGKTPRVIKSGKHDPDEYRKLWETILSGNIFRGEFINRKKNGNLMYEDLIITPIFDDEGTISHYVSSGRDITERKKAEEALQMQTMYFQQLFDRSPSGIVLRDSDNKVINANEAFTKIFQYTIGEMRGRSLSDLIVPDDRMREILHFAERRSRGEVIQMETVRRRKDGSQVEVYLTEYPILSNQKQIGIYSIYVELTEQKKLEEQLRQSQKLESLGTLAGGIAHDFNNILGIIMGHASLLERYDDDPEKFADSTRAIMKASIRGAAMVRQLLMFARKTDARIESVQINDLVNELLQLIQETFPKTIRVTAALAKSLPDITADPTQIHQVLLNLCVNARDAMPKGGTLTIATGEVDGADIPQGRAQGAAGRYVLVRVSDDGIGIDETAKRRIFDPFFTTKGIGKGTGLGLALVQSIVTGHNGFIDLESEAGRGAVFSIYFPAVTQHSETDNAHRREYIDVPGGNETILLIEDEELLRNFLRSILTARGYTVLIAIDGEEGVDMFLQHKDEIDLVVTDYGLAGLSGDEVFRKIHSIDPHARVILASGYIDPDARAALLRSGVRRFIQKPYMTGEVLEAVRATLDVPG